jgi:S-adenosylmethionine:tRNA ribosyltransferase-isomerase
MPLRTDDFDYHLPPELIADRPLAERAASRMLVVDRAAGSIRHHQFAEFPEFLTPGDLVVLNDTRVVPARYFSSDGAIELVRVDKLSDLRWQCLVRPGKKMRAGGQVRVGDATGTVTDVLADGTRIIAWDTPVDEDRHGHLALPHYMNRDDDPADRERYQTVYAREEGAIAAPTAGLHFTPEMLERVRHAFLTLHVGVGTFRPVKAEVVSEHAMHSERFVFSADCAAEIAAAQRVVAVGTTVTRVLEHLASISPDGRPQPARGETDIFIYPPYQFRAVGALLTNFHLPKSTLMMLVSAFAGRELIMDAYAEAVREKYRFFSYGDCMLLI